MKNYRINTSQATAGYCKSWWIKGPGLWSKERAFHTCLDPKTKTKDGYDHSPWTNAEVLEMLERAYEAGKDAEYYNPRKGRK